LPTINKETGLEGIGLHTGINSRIRFLPAEAGSGINFIRKDISGRDVRIKASLENVQATMRGITLASGDCKVFTVEHVLSACAGLGIDDLDIELYGPEPPAMDGSALPFANALAHAVRAGRPIPSSKALRMGQSKLIAFKDCLGRPSAKKNLLTIGRKVSFTEDKAAYEAEPYEGFRITAVFRHEHPLVRTQTKDIIITPQTYLSDIAPARTFGFREEIDWLKANGLAKGGSLENAVIVDSDKILTASGNLRFPDEFVRHKILDLIGDLYLSGRHPRLHVKAQFCGHKGNVGFAKFLCTNDPSRHITRRGLASLPKAERRKKQ